MDSSSYFFQLDLKIILLKLIKIKKSVCVCSIPGNLSVFLAFFFVLSPIVCLCHPYYQLGSLNVFVVVETLKSEREKRHTYTQKPRENLVWIIWKIKTEPKVLR